MESKIEEIATTVKVTPALHRHFCAFHYPLSTLHVQGQATGGTSTNRKLTAGGDGDRSKCCGTEHGDDDRPGRESNGHPGWAPEWEEAMRSGVD